MTNLIIALLAVALTAVMLTTTIMHLGENTENQGAKAESMKKMNEAQQIASAIAIYKGDGNVIDKDFKLEDLLSDYLTSIPKSGWKAEPYFVFSDTNVETCIEANKKANHTFSLTDSDIYVSEDNPDFPIPYCSKEGLSKNVPCCYTPEN